MKKNILISLCAGALFAFNAEATYWERVDLTPGEKDESSIFIDMGSFRIDNNELTYWEKILKQDKGYELKRILLNCEKKVEKILDLLIYDYKDKITANHSYNREWITIATDSHADKIYYLLCKDGMPREPKDREFYIKNYRKTFLLVSPDETKPDEINK